MKQMRRQECLMDAQWAQELIASCEYAYLATTGADGTPYCIAVSPVTVGDCIYFHCAPQGEKLDNIAGNARVCLSAARRVQTFSRELTVFYESAVVRGTAQVVQDAGQKRMALTKLCEKYAPNEPAGSIRRELDALLGKTAVIRISDLEYSGKSKYGK